MKNNYGFTLVELMIVVAIIGVMSAIAYPSYTSYMKKSGRADAKVGLARIADKQERYYLQNNTYATTTALLGLANPWITDEGYYSITIDDGADTSGFTATAEALAGQAKDTDCKTFSLSSTGLKTATVDATDPDADASKCW